MINDLTNCLRFADLTSVNVEKIALHEVKAGRGSARSGQASRQRQAVERQVNLLRQGLAESPEGNLVTLVRPPLEARSHIATVTQLIEDSRKEGTVIARLTPALAAQVIRPNLLTSAWPSPNPFDDRDPVIIDATLTLFDLWSPNMPPLSVFPYPLPERTAVMLGLVVVIAYCNLREVVAALEQRGLAAKLPPLDALQRLALLKPWEQIRRQYEASIVVSDPTSGREMLIPMPALKQLTGEFLDEQSFADLILATLNSPTATRHVMPAFTNDIEMWD